MVFCTKCGEELPDDAYFCPRCGARSRRGVEAGILTPWEELKDALSKMGQEIEKAFSIAGKEMERAFKTARESIRESTGKEQVVCPHCGEENLGYARFCHKCGKSLVDK
jgi:predicted RNA-binding Zn-ribbon protein involved in translation (DUF1610 family)